jgi:hypothetical protein
MPSGHEFLQVEDVNAVRRFGQAVCACATRKSTHVAKTSHARERKMHAFVRRHCNGACWMCSLIRNSAKSFHQNCETRAIFLTHGREFQPQSTAGLYMPHNCFGPDLTFFDEKMYGCLRAHGP